MTTRIEHLNKFKRMHVLLVYTAIIAGVLTMPVYAFVDDLYSAIAVLIVSSTAFIGHLITGGFVAVLENLEDHQG